MTKTFYLRLCNLFRPPFRWLIDAGKESAGMQVIVDLHGGDTNNLVACAEFEEIKDKVMGDVRGRISQIIINGSRGRTLISVQRAFGETRSYGLMWRKYKRRVLLAMSSQAFAQLVGVH